MTGYVLNAVSEHFRHIGIAQLCIKHGVIQQILGPIQLKVCLHKRGAIPVTELIASTLSPRRSCRAEADGRDFR
jgi:hypothetical protein